MNATWTIDATRILSREEIAAVLVELNRTARRSVNTRQNLAIFRLATCCGLRVSEICGLKLGDVKVALSRRPYIQVRKGTAKGKKPRRIPLWWDSATLADLRAWADERKGQGAKSGDYFVCLQTRKGKQKVTRHLVRWVQPHPELPKDERPPKEKHWEDRTMMLCRGRGARLDRCNTRARFKSACKVLGDTRLAEITIHTGRHSFVSHALAGGRTLAEVRDAAGHANIATTSVYTHVAVSDDDDGPGDIFAFNHVDQEAGSDSDGEAGGEKQ